MNEGNVSLFRTFLRDINREIRDLAENEDRRRAVIGNARFERSVGGLCKDDRPHLKTLSFSGYEENPFYYNLGGGKFVEAGVAFGLARVEDGRGLAAADLDGDGDLDLVLRNVYEPALLLFRNHAGTEKPALQIHLRGTKSNRFGIGARVWVDGRMQEMVCGEGYLSSGPPVLHFGLGEAKRARKVEIHWPSGAKLEFADVGPGSVVISETGGLSELKAFREASRAPTTVPPRPPHEGDVPEIALRRTDGTSVSPRGQWSLLCLWSVQCKSCYEESKLFGVFAEEMLGRGGAFYAVNVDDRPDELAAFVKEQKFAVPVWTCASPLLNPHEPLVPSWILLDREGRVVGKRTGVLGTKELRAWLEREGVR
ncbi:MAG: ASPIC/UnbV domain-containing protein [Planctomycetes bacterium]|nr:ASPIC/UnbV domain-containing protein [Planctomycetota bacterium]